MGWRRTARLKEPQELGQQINPKIQHNSQLKTRPILLGSGCALRGVGQRPSAQARRFYEPQRHDQQLGPTRRENKHSPALRPVSAFTAAPLSLRRFFARLARFSCFGSPPKQLNRFFRRGARVLREGTALTPGGPHVPWTGNADAFQLAASTPVLRPRADGHCPGSNCSFWLRLSPRQLGNSQTAFALPSLAASVVNKRNRKNFRAHPCGMLWPGLPAEHKQAAPQPAQSIPTNRSTS